MTLDQWLAMFGALGAVGGVIATIMCSVGLWILSAIRADIHNIRTSVDKRINDVNTRMDDFLANQTDPGLRHRRRRTDSEFP